MSSRQIDQVAARALEPIRGPEAWYGRDLAESTDWIYSLSEHEIDELDRALQETKKRNLPIGEIDADNFPLPRLGKALVDIRNKDILNGRGFVLLRGIPVEKYAVADLATLYWGLGAYIGKPVSQNGKGHLLGHVKDLGRKISDTSARIYQTTSRQTFHTDSVDIVGLMCLKTAKRGGISRIVSSITIYNEMLKRRVDLVEALFEPTAFDRRGELPPGKKPYFVTPIFNDYAGKLSVFYGNRHYIESAQRLDGVPRISKRQREALDLLDALAENPDLNLHMEFRPGDIQLLHNHTILHDRTDYEDWSDPSRKRHLLRLWLCPPNGRPLPQAYADRYNGVEIGNRGGIRLPGVKESTPLEAC